MVDSSGSVGSGCSADCVLGSQKTHSGILLLCVNSDNAESFNKLVLSDGLYAGLSALDGFIVNMTVFDSGLAAVGLKNLRQQLLAGQDGTTHDQQAGDDYTQAEGCIAGVNQSQS